MNWWWRSRGLMSLCLLPLTLVYRIMILIRRLGYRTRVLKTYRSPVPIIIVGNITIGGTGKTPFTLALVNNLQESGFNPGIVTRGYRGEAKQFPLIVEHNSDPKLTGDEALLIKQETNCPVYVDPNRVRGVKAMLNNEKIDVIISDDGLQHYALGRHIEIAMMDGERKLGNQHCLPSGPLREPPSRLSSVDFIVTTGDSFTQITPWHLTLTPVQFVNCKHSLLTMPLHHLSGMKVHAVAGIGHPKRFFDELTRLGLFVIPHAFPDHYSYQPNDFDTFIDAPVIMTSKDAIKLHQFADENWWYLQIKPEIDRELLATIKQRITCF